MAIIRLYPPEPADKTKAIGFYVPTDPDKPDGDQCKYYVIPFESGDAQQLLSFMHEFARLMDMKGATKSPKQMMQTMRLLLRDKALKVFEKAYEEPHLPKVDDDATTAVQQATRDANKELELEAFKNGVRAFLEELLPANAGSKIKDDLQSFHKPCDMKVNEFFLQIEHLNEFIELCPDGECEMDEKELKTLLEQACPSAWAVDLKKPTDYHNVDLVEMRFYYKLLKGLEDKRDSCQTERNRRGYQGLQGGYPRASGYQGSGKQQPTK